MSLKYRYVPLRDGEIRVLELSPSSFQDPVIHCNIKSIRIEPDSFDAVSYTWGASSSTRVTIICNESHDQLDVPFNCYNALRHLRYPNRPRTLWIDAICINQSDKTEKSSQVGIMGQIFVAAYQTVIFLGVHTPGSRNLWPYLTGRRQQTGPNTTPLSQQQIIRETEELFQRPWFSRIWAVQELMKSRRPEFMCGHDTASFETLTLFIYGGARNYSILKFPVPLQINEEYFQAQLTGAETAAQQMLLLAAGTSLCQSTEPHDRILALIPLITYQLRRPERFINYNQSAEELFHQFALLVLEEAGLALLSMIRHPQSIQGLPSWVPDWTETTDKTRFIPHLEVFFYRHRRSQYNQYFRTERLPDVRDFSPQHLIVRGCRYGRIDAQGPVIHIRQESFLTRIRDVGRLVNDFKSMQRGAQVHGWPASIMEAIRRISGKDVAMLLRSGIETELGPDTINEATSTNVAIGCNETRVFITAEGKLGLCPEAAKKGDLVCLVSGAFEPCILRERDNQWVLGYDDECCGSWAVDEAHSDEAHSDEEGAGEEGSGEEDSGEGSGEEDSGEEGSGEGGASEDGSGEGDSDAGDSDEKRRRSVGVWDYITRKISRLDGEEFRIC
ncbi:HET-domain-containing protein [Ustulina deusta]|nr:HET-domain-containing protein [Ustulina deusta]